MLRMGLRRVTGVTWLREVSRGAPKANKAIIDFIIDLHEKSEIVNLKTAENIIERLASKAARKIYTDKPTEFTTNWWRPHRSERL